MYIHFTSTSTSCMLRICYRTIVPSYTFVFICIVHCVATICTIILNAIHTVQCIHICWNNGKGIYLYWIYVLFIYCIYTWNTKQWNKRDELFSMCYFFLLFILFSIFSLFSVSYIFCVSYFVVVVDCRLFLLSETEGYTIIKYKREVGL